MDGMHTGGAFRDGACCAEDDCDERATWPPRLGDEASDNHTPRHHDSAVSLSGSQSCGVCSGEPVAESPRPASPRLHGSAVSLLDHLVASARRRQQQLPAELFSPSPSTWLIAACPDAAPELPIDTSDLLLPALAAFWRHAHPAFPLIHRASFERGFRGKSTVYGSRPPLALAYAAAALGARNLHGLGERQRLAYERFCCERARQLLLARDGDDIETLQALALLVAVLVVADLPARLFVVMRRCATSVERLYGNLPLEAPSTANRWIFRELVLRLRIYIGCFDVSVAYHSRKPSFGSYFDGGVFPLPLGEAYFDNLDPYAAFRQLREDCSDGLPAVALGGREWGHVLSTVSSLASAPHSCRASILAYAHLASFARHLQARIPGRDPDGGQARLRIAAAQLGSLADAKFASLPPAFGPALARGDPRPLLRSPLFPSKAYAHSALQMLLMCESLAAEPLLAAGFRGAAASRCARYARILRHQLAHDPVLEHGNHILAAPAFFVGRVLLTERQELEGTRPYEMVEAATERMERLREVEEGVETVAKALEAYAAEFGLQPRKLAAKFAEEMHASGILLERRIEHPKDAELAQDDAADGAAVFHADMVLRGSGAAPAWLPVPGRGGSVDFSAISA
ncbi:hypothetical protein DFJ74DRAFT_10101 [Hyaloraphidium curvatum]|nr:hypothetical protein DFJ74DRAFT_10101 [Hyaloraphidium curvatum]